MSQEINLIEGERGKLHVTSDDARTENALIFGTGRKVLNLDNAFEATLEGNNTVRITSGVLYNNGMFIRIDRDSYVEVTIENGLAGTYRNDLICIAYSRNIQTQLESATVVVKKGVTAESRADLKTPTCTQGDVLDLEVHTDEFPLYLVQMDGIHPVLNPLFTVEDTISNIQLHEDLLEHVHDTDNPHQLPYALSAKAGGSALRADKADCDSSGRNIVNTYAVKKDVESELATKVELSEAGVNAAINKLGTGSASPADADYYISQFANGGTTTKTYHRRPMSALWEYIKSKISSVLGLTKDSYGGTASSANKVNGHTVNSDVPANAKFTDTTYAAATTSKAGLMSADDKAAIEGLKTGAVTGVKGSAEKEYRSGNVEITWDNLGLGTAAGYDMDEFDLRAYGHKANYVTCSTATATATKQLDITDRPYTLKAGDLYIVRFINGNTATGLKFTILYHDTTTYNVYINDPYIYMGSVVAFVFDGTAFRSIGSQRVTSDSQSASALSTGQGFATERDVYYGTPKINNSHAYTSNSVFYAPVSAGTKGYMLESSGGTSAPVWKSNPCRCYSEIINVTFTNGHANVKKDLTTLDGFTGVYDAKFQAWGAVLYIVSYVTDGTPTSYRHQLAIIDGGTWSGTVQVKATYFYN